MVFCLVLSASKDFLLGCLLKKCIQYEFFYSSSSRRSSSGFKICKGVTAKMLLMHLCKNYMQLLLEALEYKAKRSSGIKNIPEYPEKKNPQCTSDEKVLKKSKFQ